MIASVTAVCTFTSAAADDTLVFSFTEASSNPGGTVDITINIDKNPGFWSLGMILYHSDKLTLRDISYGTLTPEKYFFNSAMNVSVDSLGAPSKEALERVGVSTEGLMAMLVSAINEDSITENITGTGKLLTLSFEVAADAPAGDYVVGATIKDAGDFADAITLGTVPVHFSNIGKISVSGGAPADPNMNYGTPTNPDAAGSNGYYEKHPEYAPGNQSPVETGTTVTPQTDAKGNVVTNEAGQPVPAETKPEEYKVVTDNNGEIVYETDAEGNKSPKTEKVVDTSKADDNKDSDKKDINPAKTAAIVIGVVLVCAGAAGIIFVFATRKSSGNDKNDDVKSEDIQSEDKNDDVKSDDVKDDNSSDEE